MGTLGTIRVGLAGLGRFGTLHASVLSQLPDVELAALCEPDITALNAALATHTAAKGFSDFDKMIDSIALDAVFIVSPEPLHAGQARAALERGIAVFVEKPLAMEAAEAESLAALARATGLPLQVGFVLRFDVQHQLLRIDLEQGALGDIVSIRTKRNVSREWFPSFGDRAHPIQETAIHDLDLVLWYARSTAQRVHAIERNISGMTYPDACWALIEFASGAVAIVETSWFVPAGAPANVVTSNWRGTIDAEIEVIGTLGTRRVRLLDAPYSMWTADFTAMPEIGMWPAIGGEVKGALREEDAHFMARVRGAPELLASVEDAITGLRIGEAIVASARSGTAIDL
jgi:predicted dehydrogenase